VKGGSELFESDRAARSESVWGRHVARDLITTPVLPYAVKSHMPAQKGPGCLVRLGLATGLVPLHSG
jgi:hypothetical protein